MWCYAWGIVVLCVAGQLKANNAQLMEGAVQAVQNLAQQCSDPTAVQDVVTHLFKILGGELTISQIMKIFMFGFVELKQHCCGCRFWRKAHSCCPKDERVVRYAGFQTLCIYELGCFNMRKERQAFALNVVGIASCSHHTVSGASNQTLSSAVTVMFIPYLQQEGNAHLPHLPLLVLCLCELKIQGYSKLVAH